MILPVTCLFAACLGLVFVLLSALVIRQRVRTRSLVGSEHPDLHRAVRAHANFAEYVPLGLVLLALLEMNAVAAWLLYALGGALLAGRVAHAYATMDSATADLAARNPRLLFRPAGMVLTLGMLGASAALLLLRFVR